MMTLSAFTEFVGWCTTINVALYLIITVCVMLMPGMLHRLNSRLFALDEEVVKLETFRYIANYKLIITTFCIVPYVALRIMG